MNVKRALEAAAKAVSRTWYPNDPEMLFEQMEPDDREAIRAAVLAFLEAVPDMTADGDPESSRWYYFTTPRMIIAAIKAEDGA
jgi:hypothetical protein